jgi:ribose/xylose/arabinose/galactoside ABC-type transport system permease subunit
MTAPPTDSSRTPPTPVAARSAAPDSPPARRRTAPQLLWPAIGLALLLGFDAIFIGNFFKITVVDGRLAGTLVEVFRWSGPEILLAIGMTLVLATGGVDLSVGAVMALAGAIVAELLTVKGWPPVLAIVAAIFASLVAGAWNGALVTLLEIQPIVATLVLMVAGRGIAQTIGGSAHVEVSGKIFERLGGASFGLPTEGLVGLLVFILTAAFVRLTSAGLLIEATGNNRTASRYAGVNVKLVTFLVYVFCGLCAGLGGLLQTADVRGADASQMGIYWELDAILAAVIGGTSLTGGRFSLLGAVLGAVLIVTLTTSIQSKVPIEYALVYKAVVVLVICLLQSEAFRQKVLGRR